MQLAHALEVQAGHCDVLGSPLYARLLRAAADDVRAGGAVHEVLATVAGEPQRMAAPLRLMAGVHRLVLERRAPALAVHYPSVGGTPGGDVEQVFLATVAAHQGDLHAEMRLGLQTNEVGRAAALLVGFLDVARTTGLPLRCLEVGASAGLILRWDRYRYTGSDFAWGPEDARLILADIYAEPPASAAAVVAERRGCDPAPLDPTSQEGRIRLTAAVWPDQTRRLERLRAALAEAAATPATVDQADVATWLPGQLAQPADGRATVVYQSVVEQYLPPASRDARDHALAEAASRARRTAPLAHLKFEPDRGTGDFAVDLTLWPGGDTRRLATASPHGDAVRVLQSP